MAWLGGVATAFFEQDASEERKAMLRNNLAQLPPGTSFDQSLPAQAPMRFYDARTDMMPLYQDMVVRPELLSHLLGPLTKDWDVTRAPSSLRVPLLLTHGRYDYTVRHTLWDGIEAVLPMATRRVFSRSGHQPFFEEPDEFTRAVAEWMKAQV